MSRTASMIVAVLVGVAAHFLGNEPARAASVPSGYEDRLVTQVLQPTSLAFTPDGRMLITTQPGFLQVYDPATGDKKNVLDLRDRICSNSERGLLGVAVDPDFGSNSHVYLYYTKRVGTTCDASRDDVNRVSRFSMSGGADAASSERVLVDNIPSPGGNHNGGDLHFGKDGNLYVSVGDGGRDYRNDSGAAGENDASRDRNVLLGKILRVTRDGGIPADNPYAAATNGARCALPVANGRTAQGNVCKETFAMGLRNPFRMAFDPDASGTRFNINDVGQNAWEEIDYGKKGADYGWNLCEGRHDNPDRPGSVTCGPGPYTPPISEYSHASGCSSVTGAAFVPNGAWPASYNDSYLFGDYVCGKIFRLTPAAGGGYERTTFASGLGRGGPVAMVFGPSGRDLYYTTYAGGDGGQIRRITYTRGNQTPNAAIEANPPHAQSPGDLTIDFAATGSRDPDADALTHAWDFDYDGQTFTADPNATGSAPSHTYDAPGKRTAALRVTDDGGLSDTATIEVFPGNMPPEPAIQSPMATERFRVGQQVELRGSATDVEDATAPTLRWEVRRWHSGQHFHPFAQGEGDALTFVAPGPEDLLATDPEGNFLELRLTAADSEGLSKTVTRRLEPKTVDVTFATRPTNLNIVVNGRMFRAPKTFLSWEGYGLNVSAPRQRKGGKRYVFRSWSDGGAANHVIVTPADYTKYTATFRRP